MEIKQQRRAALLKLTSYMANSYGLPEGQVPCHVLGIFQETSEDGAEPVAVCEFDDGRVTNVSTGYIKFVDTDEMGVIR